MGLCGSERGIAFDSCRALRFHSRRSHVRDFTAFTAEPKVMKRNSMADGSCNKCHEEIVISLDIHSHVEGDGICSGDRAGIVYRRSPAALNLLGMVKHILSIPFSRPSGGKMLIVSGGNDSRASTFFNFAPVRQRRYVCVTSRRL